MRKPRLSKLDRLDKFDMFLSLTKKRSFQILISVVILYTFLVTLELPFVFNSGFSSLSQDPITRPDKLESEHELEEKRAPTRPLQRLVLDDTESPRPSRLVGARKKDVTVSSLRFDPENFDPNSKDGSVELHKSAKTAWELGRNLWEDIESGKIVKTTEKPENRANAEKCPHSVSLSGSELRKRGSLMELTCGLTLGSHVTIVGKPRKAHWEKNPKISEVKEGEESVMVSQFIIELQGLKTVEGEEPPKILHLNPRLRGDFSGKPVIEHNTCYRMQWGRAQRCEGWRSGADEETVDGQVKCEKWSDDDGSSTEENKSSWWLNRVMRRKKTVTVDWPFPFTEEKVFVLTLSAGLEGYHVNLDGRHVSSFPYRTGFTLEDATGLTIKGDIDVNSVFAGSLPTSHPSFAPQRHLELSNRWRAPPLVKQHVEMFIGILSAGNHFAERMAARKSWMQHRLVQRSTVVARFFVALHARKEVNLELKKEAEFFGDIVIVPYMDNYDLVVLKTVAICKYGAQRASARYVMKCDDDTFVRVDAVLDEARKVPERRSLYIGNMNYYHKPLREGKWAVTYEEWPEEAYPPYANGPGYILSNDIAHSIVDEFETQKLRLFKMEDVSMGMWVEQFNNRTNRVDYLHSLKFCQFGCIEDYYTAHYQSPKQMICLWHNLVMQSTPQCCNMR